MAQNPSQKPNILPTNQGISRILWNTQIYSVQTSCFIFKVHFNITVPSTNNTYNWRFSSGFSVKIIYTFSSVSYAPHVSSVLSWSIWLSEIYLARHTNKKSRYWAKNNNKTPVLYIWILLISKMSNVDEKGH
jgi:hypothetical protein